MGWEVTNLSKQWTGREYTVYKQIATLGKPPATTVEVGFSRGIRLCVGGSLDFLIDDLTVYGRWHIFRVDRHPQCSGSFGCLGSHPSLANRTGPNVEVVVARCRNCSSKLCWKCGQCGLRSLQQKAADQRRGLPRK